MKNIKNKKLLIILVIYLFITIFFCIKNVVLFINIINPLFWSCIILYFIFNKKNIYLRLEKKDKNYLYITVLSFIYIISYFYLGSYFGFVKSPYNHKISSIMNNIFIQVIPIIGIEITRTIITLKNKNNKILIYFITILLVFLEINYKSVIDIIFNKKELFEYICKDIIPAFINGTLYTYLTLKTSYISTLIFRINIKLVALLSPFLPNLDWFINSSFNILFPIIIYLIYKYIFLKQKEDVRMKKQNIYYKLSYIITIIILILLICFMVGVFRYEPITILSNSMSQIFSKGYVVIYKKINVDEIKNLPINSIIIYSKQEKNIAHRIINKIKEDNNILFETKGDNNNEPDMELVKIEQVKGVYVFHIKYIGYPSVWLYDYFNIE